MSPKKSILPVGTQVPNHIAIIPDGNRRWARSRGLNPSDGHRAGADRTQELIRAARNWGVHTVTFWGLSTENWKARSPSEIKTLIHIIGDLVDKNLDEAMENDVRIIHLGRKDRLPKILLKKLARAEETSRHNKSYILNLALDYGGRDEVLRAIQQIVASGVPEKEVTPELIESHLDTHDQPYPYVDLLIRTSGEQRTSGLLMWQTEYAEMYWSTEHLPDFTKERLEEAILDYSRRRRRFGGNDSLSQFRFKPSVTARLEVSWWRLANIPSGMKFSEYATNHIREQWGLSTSLAKEGAKLMVEAFADGEAKKWKIAAEKLHRFYQIVREEVKLAFEPSIAAQLQVNLWQKAQNPETTSIAEMDQTSRALVSEIYRISDLQASKAAHLMSLATIERSLAKGGDNDPHWKKAEDYLSKYYSALKDRIA